MIGRALRAIPDLQRVRGTRRLRALRGSRATRLTVAALARLVTGIAAIALGALACRQGDPIEPTTPANVPVPTKLDRPDDRKEPTAPAPKISRDAGAENPSMRSDTLARR